MSNLTIQPHTGPQAGSALTFETGPVTFGRSPDNDLVLDDPHVSRHHGTLRAEGEGWRVEARGENGLSLDGDELEAESAELPERATIGVGRAPLFEATIVAGEEGDAPAASAGASRSPQRWIWYGAYLAFLLAMAVVIATFTSPESAESELGTKLSRTQIRKAILVPVPQEDPSARVAQAALARARTHVERLESRPDALFRAYRAFRRSLAHREAGHFPDPVDQLRYHQVQRRLIARFHERYERAYRLLRNQRYRSAEKAFDALSDFFPDRDHELYAHIQKKRRLVMKRRSG